VHVRIWEYVVRSSAVAAFAELYGPGGRWVQHFSAYDGFLATELLTDASDATRFVTIDRWEWADAYDRVDTGAEAWRALDDEGER